MKEYTDAEIIDCLKNRQSYVVQWLSDRYLPMIKLMVMQMGGSREDAKDIFQDGLIILLEKIDDKTFALTCKFKTYLYCVCEILWKQVLLKRHAASNYLNRKLDEESDTDITELLDHKTYESIFYTAFATLEPVCQTILKLYWQEISPKEIARKLGCSYGYIRKKKSEAQADLIRKVKCHPDYKLIMNSENAVNTT